MSNELIEAGIAVLFALLAWGIRKLSLESQLKEEIVNAVQRGKDKILPEIVAARADGVITDEEKSEIRQAIFDLLKTELKGPLLRLLLTKSEHLTKGLISRVMDKLGVK